MQDPITILIVDDNHQNLKVVSNFLKEAGYRLALALNGKDALNIIRKIKVHLVLLDIMMPEMDGIETCKIIKNDPEISDIPVIFLTAKTQTEDIVEGFEAGGVDYITKPFQREELLVRVKNHVSLSLAKEKIIEMNKTRDKLYTIIAHDIKSPFSSIVLSFNMINGGLLDTGSEDFKQVMRDLETTTVQTKGLIDNLLQWANYSTIPENFKLKSNPILPIASECVMLLKGSASQKNIHIDINIPEDMTAWFDEVSIHTILRNLISNAVKFTNQNGKITINATKSENEKIMLSVEDTGVGMTKEMIQKVFKTDESVSTMGTKNERGTGIGLSLVKGFTEKNNGRLHVESTPGKGTVITLELLACEPEKEKTA